MVVAFQSANTGTKRTLIGKRRDRRAKTQQDNKRKKEADEMDAFFEVMQK